MNDLYETTPQSDILLSLGVSFSRWRDRTKTTYNETNSRPLAPNLFHSRNYILEEHRPHEEKRQLTDDFHEAVARTLQLHTLAGEPDGESKLPTEYKKQYNLLRGQKLFHIIFSRAVELGGQK